MKIITAITAITLMTLSCSRPADNHLVLWYNQPAADWNQALPVGNGRIGAMVFGDPFHERIQINEESIWAGCPVNNNNPEALKALPLLQKALFDSRFKEAWQLAQDNLLGTPPQIRSYQPLGDLIISYGWKTTPDHYRRSLDLKTGMATNSFSVEGKRYEQQVYASVPDNMLVVKIKSLDGGSLDASFSLNREKDASIIASDDETILLRGQIMDEENPVKGPAGAHMKFAGMLRLTHQNGELRILEPNADSGVPQLQVTGARGITLRITAASDYSLDKLDFDRSINPVEVCSKILDQAQVKSDKQLLKRHLNEYQPIFERVSLDLGDSELDSLPTDVRLSRMKDGSQDKGLITLYFQYGRYLLMGSSRGRAVLPANLQGIWNKDMNAAWNSDFHTNINLQMNYWPAEVCNLSETTLPLINFMQKLMVPGARTAREMYGTEGWVFHHLVDPFGRTGVADGVWGITPLNGPWMTMSAWEHFLFSRDTTNLREVIWPMMKGSAEFVLGFLTESPEGYLVTNPSHSPENAFYIPGTRDWSSLTYSATIDIEILNAFFNQCREACRILDVDAGFAQRLAKAQKRFPPVRINSKGVIQEWIMDYEEPEPGHRHMSHLLGLYPMAEFTPETPDLFNAARATIERRLSFGGGQTGWSRAWIICMYARLLDGEKAYQNVTNLLTKCTLDNLFDTHPPFQIDGNFGGTAGIAEMMIQSHNGVINLLPAIPKSMSSGRVRGLCARGGFEVDMQWDEGKLTEAFLFSKKGGSARIIVEGKEIAVELKPGQKKKIL